jgi:hypothetical protein
VPDALDDAALLERIDSAIADGGRLLAELGRLRAAVAARIPAEPGADCLFLADRNRAKTIKLVRGRYGFVTNEAR